MLRAGHVLTVQGLPRQDRYAPNLSHAPAVLAAQPDVNPNAFGCLGFSGSGQETLWLS